MLFFRKEGVYGSYKVVSLISEGGMSVVCLAENLDKDSSPRRVALKVLNPGINELAQEMYRVWNKRLAKASEGDIALRLVHPNVIKTLGYGKNGDEIYIVMEYFESENLRRVIAADFRRIIPIRYCIMLQAAEGLSYLWEQRIIHRDISPKNILIDREDRIKIIDFGLALTKAELKVLGTGYTDGSGTAGYLSPEQLRREPIDQRVDVYAFGATLYEIATGMKAFSGTKEQRETRQMNPSLLIPPRKRDKTIPEELENLILRCLNQNRKERPNNLIDVRNQLSVILSRFQ